MTKQERDIMTKLVLSSYEEVPEDKKSYVLGLLEGFSMASKTKAKIC